MFLRYSIKCCYIFIALAFGAAMCVWVNVNVGFPTLLLFHMVSIQLFSLFYLLPSFYTLAEGIIILSRNS